MKLQQSFLSVVVSLGLALLVGGSSSAAFATPASRCESDESFPEISKQELEAKIQSKSVFVVDVNSSESFQKNHVPGAIHFGSHSADFAQTLPKQKDTLIVAYCGGPQCTAWRQAAQAACHMGYTQVRHFKGGISGWLAKGHS